MQSLESTTTWELETLAGKCSRADGSPWLTDLERSRDPQGNRSGVERIGRLHGKAVTCRQPRRTAFRPSLRTWRAISSYSDANSYDLEETIKNPAQKSEPEGKPENKCR